MDTLSAISLTAGIIGTAIAIYQYAVINESKKRNKELQYLLAGVNNLAIQKVHAWNNQLGLIPNPEEDGLERVRLAVRARDDCGEIASLTVALEGTIDPECSAITGMMKKGIEIVKDNNTIQSEGLKNPHNSQPKEKEK